MPSSSHALGVQRQVFSGWAHEGQRQSLVTLRKLQKKTQVHTWTRSLGTVSGRRWQTRLAKLGNWRRPFRTHPKGSKPLRTLLNHLNPVPSC